MNEKQSDTTTWQQPAENLRNAQQIYQRAARLRSEAAQLHSSAQPPAELHDPAESIKAARTGESELDQTAINHILREIALEKDEFKQLAEQMLGPEGSDERRLLQLSGQELVKALREDRKLELASQKILEGVLSEEGELAEPGLKQLRAHKTTLERKGVPADYLSRSIASKELELANISKERHLLKETSPEAFYALNLMELRRYHDQLMEGRIVETPYVRRQAEEITTYLEAGVPVLVHGHLGAGKTELSMFVAKEYLGKEALVISGSKHTGLADFYGHQILTIGSTEESQAQQVVNQVEQRYQQWLVDNEQALNDLGVDEAHLSKEQAHDRLLQSYIALQGSGTVSDFFLGPIYRAMAEGRPVIIDEVNAIPHEVLISLNHILTRKPGDAVPVQQNSGSMVTVAEGFCVIMTGNLEKNTTRYVQRQELDAAFLSRLHVMEHDYLPQTLEGSYKVAATEQAANEQFALILANLADRRGRLEIPEDSLTKLWNMAKAARLLQDVFAGKQIEGGMFNQGGEQIAGSEILDKSVLSIRSIDKILRIWRQDNFRYELDHYLYTEFVAASTDPVEKAYIYQVLREQFDFFKGEGWPGDDELDYGSNGIIGSFAIADPMRLSGKRVFYSTEDTIEGLYGPPPERKEFPEANGATEAAASAAEAEQLRGQLDALLARLGVTTQRIGSL